MKKELCQITQLPRSTINYKAKDNKPGSKPSMDTIYQSHKVSNTSVVDSIKSLLDHEFICYGYIKITKQLQQDGFLINKKKVYRLMKEQRLLQPQRFHSKGKRSFVKFRKPQATGPLNYFEMDIKYIYIPQEHRNFYLLSIIDVYSRKVVGHIFKHSIRKYDVIKLWQSLKTELNDFKKITIRSDNGSQFIANDVRGYFKYQGIEHEFTHIATPEDDGHIEAFHSILEREMLQRNEYISYEEMKQALNRFIHFYNHERIHGSLNYQSPVKFLDQFFLNQPLINNLKTYQINDELCQTTANL